MKRIKLINENKKVIIDFETGSFLVLVDDKITHRLTLDKVERFCLYSIAYSNGDKFKNEIRNMLKEYKVFFPSTRITLEWITNKHIERQFECSFKFVNFIYGEGEND